MRHDLGGYGEAGGQSRYCETQVIMRPWLPSHPIDDAVPRALS